jgi:hypothetical protein
MQTSSFLDWTRKYASGLYELNRIRKAKTWPKNSIVYYVGKPKDGLTPHSLAEGTSGSHTAVIYLAREWAKLGYDVTVFSNCGDREGVYDGVRYLNYYYFNWYDTFDVLLIWRHPYMLRPRVKARRIGLEWQDVLDPPKCFPRDVMRRFDVIFSKSQFQRGLVPELPDSKFAIVSNGIDRSIAKYYDWEKNPHRLVYASRYYRGLEDMLAYGWPIIKQAIPEAELHLYYGFNRVEMGPDKAIWRKKMMALMEQPGVVNHGRVGQGQLIEEKAQSAIHYYGCTFEEVDCISVRESAAVGCVPVTTDFAVLSEKDYCHKVPGDPKKRATQEAVAHRIVELLQNPDELKAVREHCFEKAKDDAWDKIAKTWLANLVAA